MSLRLRLLLAVTLAVLFHAGFGIALQVHDARTSLAHAQRAQTELALTSLKNALANALITNDFATVQSTVALLYSEDRFLRLAVMDNRGTPIIDLRPKAVDAAAAPAWFIDFLDLELEPITATVTIAGVQYGSIVALASPATLIGRVWNETRQATLAAVIELGALSGLVWLLLAFGLRPLKVLSATVQRIGRGDLAARVPETTVREFSGLTTVVNGMAAQVSALLEHTRAQAASEVQARRLRQFLSVTHSPVTTSAKIQAVLEMACKDLEMTASTVVVVHGDGYGIEQAYTIDENPRFTRGASPCPHDAYYHDMVLKANDVVSVHDAGTAVATEAIGVGVKAYIGAPITVDGRTQGVLSFASTTARETAFHLGDLEFVRLIGQWIGLTLERDGHERALWEEKERAQVTLASIGDAVVTTDVAGKVTYLNGVAENMTGWSLAEVNGRPLPEIFHIVHEETREPVQNPVTQCLAENRVVGLTANTMLIRRDGVEFAIEDSAAPIQGRDGQTLGAVLVFHDTTQARALARQLEYYASHDQLTDLPNRRLFESTLDRVLQSAKFGKKTHALCYMDLDHFKIVNDTCGHSAGDELLRQITALLKSRLRGTDVLSRLGGDEFGLIFNHINEPQALAAAEEIRGLVRGFGFHWQGKVFEIGASIGLVMLDAAVGDRAEVMRQADIACYAAKHSGRNRAHLYRANDAQNTRLSAEMQWVQRLREAIHDGRFELWYQPIVAIQQGGGCDYGEILLRLVDLNGELIPPSAFLPAAERYGLMPEIDRWVIAHVLEHAAAEAAAGRAFRCAMNLSGSSVDDSGLFPFIEEAIRRAGVVPNTLCFEITEMAVINNMAVVVGFINKLRALGCRFALDHFGTGLSSFTYLKHIPVDYIKIDGEFVSKMAENPVDAATVEAINRIGQVMGKKTVAEFVENDAIFERLKILGVNFAQGYGIAIPQPLIAPPNPRTSLAGAADQRKKPR